MSKSIIASFREQQLLEETSAHLGFSGLAMVARHNFIEARAQAGAEYILRLLAAGKEEKARNMMDQADWGLAEAEHEMSHFNAKEC